MLYNDFITALLSKYPQSPRRAWSRGLEGIKVFCPCHDDGKPSLHIINRDGDAQVRCYAGCDRSDIIAAINGASFNKVIYERAKTFSADAIPPWKLTIARIYDYQDCRGDVVFQKVRFDPKDFRMRQPTSREGRYKWSVPMSLFTVYHLPQVLASQTVFILEGEKACDEAAKWGLVTTCSPNGASKKGESLAVKWLARYTEYFVGKHVILLPDNDEPGQNFMSHIHGCLHDVLSKTIIALPRLDAKEDFYDWANLRGGTLDELRGLWVDARKRM